MDVILWVLCAAFAVWELFAHFVARNRGAHTLSNRIWALEQRWPPARILVGVACAALFAHLTFQAF